MTEKRMTFMREFMDFMGLGGRLRLEWISSAEAQKYVEVITDFTTQIKAMGPSPIKRAVPATPFAKGGGHERDHQIIAA